MNRVETAEAAQALAERLNGAERERPVVVVTTPSGRHDPWIEIDRIVAEVGDLAEVHLMSTGAFTWSFSAAMPPMTQVFGGAGRVYPVGHAWTTDPRLAPLRFAYAADEGPRATDRLIDDAMTMAALAGLGAARPSTRRRHAEGVVNGIVADRALVGLDERQLGPGYVSPALAVPGLAVERVLVKGQRVRGWLDDRRWFDLREMLLAPQVAVARYEVGDLVLAEVGEVREATAELFLHPQLPVVVDRDDVTGNERDDLRTLLSRGEVVPARLTAAATDPQLSLLDVDDDEEPVPAASLTDGGPPWLVPPPDPVPFEVPAVAPAEVAPTLVAPRPPVAPPPAPAADAAPPPRPRPSPAMFDPHRRAAARPVPPPVVPAASAELDAARRARDDALQQVDGLQQETRLLRQERNNLESRVASLEKQLTDQRARLRKEKRRAPSAAAAPQFADPAAGLRHAVTTAWATRTPVGEQAAVPLPDFEIGPEFMPSLERLVGVSAEKVADVVFEVVTDRAPAMAGREMHQYRAAEGGGSPAVRREPDGATLWRVNLQTNTASARRLHFWRLPGGGVELCAVGLHDERPPV